MRHEKDVSREGRKPGEAAKIIGTSSALMNVLGMIPPLAQSQENILVSGESGTGKELVAAALHNESPCAAGPFIAVNCAAIQESLMENELFGHEKGAFTSAGSSQLGLFEAADGGTLFIDEVGEMPGPLQAKLLRVLEEKRVRRLGSTIPLPVQVRVISATNRDLWKEVCDGQFRLDLYYRLNVLDIDIPPLRDRREDIPLLVEHFLKQHPNESQTVTASAMHALVRSEWPGNIRQLRNALRRAQILAEGSSIQMEHLPMEVQREGARISTGPTRERVNLEDLERTHVLKALEKTNWNKAQAASHLSISRQRLYRLMHRHRLGQ